MTNPYFQTAFSPEEFAGRRSEILRVIGKDSVAVLAGAPATGAFDRFRQTNDFYYLCGVEVPHAYLLIDGRSGNSTLYLAGHDAKHARSEGEQLHSDAPDVVARLTGIERIAPLGALARHIADARFIFTPFAPAEGREACRDVLQHAMKQRLGDPYARHQSPEEFFCDKLAQLVPQAQIENLSPILDNMRLIKSSAEIEVMRHAGKLTADAVVLAMRGTRPDAFEYELAAIADHHFLASGAAGPGYRPIVASGTNIWNAHYYRNDCRLQTGDLVLMDYAPDVANYTSDIGRMWPVSGTYSPVQRELYGFVVAYHEVLLKTLRPHQTVVELAKEAAKHIHDTWCNWPFSKESYRAAALKMIDSPVAFTHPVGMAVHDVGQYKGDPLRPGFVFALDPQLWVEDEQLYIRVEDTVAIMHNGAESLTSRCPLHLQVIESLVGKPQ